jgi:hypothetical protein
MGSGKHQARPLGNQRQIRCDAKYAQAILRTTGADEENGRANAADARRSHDQQGLHYQGNGNARADVRCGQERWLRESQLQRSGANYSGDIVCKGPDLVGQGKIKGSFSGREAFSSSYEFKGSAHGQSVEQRHDSAGKWLAADCGDIKPMDHLAGAR